MATSADEVYEWNEQGVLVEKLAEIMTAGYDTAVIKQFFEWLRANVPKGLYGIDWRKMRQELVDAARSDEFRANLALFFLTVADPKASEYSPYLHNNYDPLFPRTKRPLTAHLDVADNQAFLIRVVRYMNSPTKGLWHTQTPDQNFGTFYYYEPDSVTMISCAPSRVLFAANKIHAAYLLLQKVSDRDNLLQAFGTCYAKLVQFNEPNIAAIQSPAFKKFVLTLLDTLAHDDMASVANHPLLKLSYWGHPVHLVEDIDHTMRRSKPCTDDWGLSCAESHRLSPTYVGYTIWSRMDPLDVPLATAAREAGYDLIVLQAEAGRRQAVSEVLDTRPREESFQSLIRLPLTVPPDALYDPTAPAVYYPRTVHTIVEELA